MNHWDWTTRNPVPTNPHYLMTKCSAYRQHRARIAWPAHTAAFWLTRAHARPCYDNIAKVLKKVLTESVSIMMVVPDWP